MGWPSQYQPLCWLPWLVAGAHAASPYIMSWSDKSYGPNGPWRSVTIYVSSDNQPLDVIPGARWASTLITSSLCANDTLSSTCFAQDAGVYDTTTSTSAVNATTDHWASWDWDVPGSALLNIVGDSIALSSGGSGIANVSITAVRQAYQTYPDGSDYPVNIGTLSLGAPSTEFNRDSTSMTYVTYGMYTDGTIPSYSYGMHIGSAALDIPGSLLLGGYDRNRVLGEVTAQSFTPVGGNLDGGSLVIKLQDIGIGVATGGSPFGYSEKKGLLAKGNSSMVSGPEIEINPLRPYLYLPQSTCEAIAAELPVTFHEPLGLYLWNTSDSRYENVVSSPSFLSFAFEKNANNQESLEIKVPFALLNLTLEQPLVDTPTPYFPCFHWDDTPLLGRALLQAAFVGVNWGEGEGSGSWFLAQAPGPGLTSNPSVAEIGRKADTIGGSGSSWEQSWEGYWTPLSEDSPTSSASGDGANSGGGLSTGAKAGIGVGCAVAGLILLGSLAWILVLRGRRRAAPADTPSTPYGASAGGVFAPNEKKGLHELESDLRYKKPVEMPTTTAYEPVGGPRHELG